MSTALTIVLILFCVQGLVKFAVGFLVQYRTRITRIAGYYERDGRIIGIYDTLTLFINLLPGAASAKWPMVFRMADSVRYGVTHLPDVEDALICTESLPAETLGGAVRLEIDGQQPDARRHPAKTPPHRGGLPRDVPGQIDFAYRDCGQLGQAMPWSAFSSLVWRFSGCI